MNLFEGLADGWWEATQPSLARRVLLRICRGTCLAFAYNDVRGVLPDISGVNDSEIMDGWNPGLLFYVVVWRGGPLSKMIAETRLGWHSTAFSGVTTNFKDFKPVGKKPNEWEDSLELE